jgi:sulfotransferase family protein
MTSLTESRAGALPIHSRAPDFFIVGHHKSGTTALFQMLRAHPQIYMPELKEPRFFASDLRPLFEPSPSARLPHTLDEYLALFDAAGPEQRVGEASPSYLRSSTAAAAIAALYPAARIIAILREPASFVRSLHLQLVRDRVETERDLARAFAAESIVRAGRSVLRYSDHVRYVEQLCRYGAVFPPQQVLVLIYDDFRADNEGTVRRVLRFLDVDDAQPIAAVEANPAVQVRPGSVRRKAVSLYGGHGPLARALTAGVGLLPRGGRGREALRAIRRRLLYTDPPPADVEVMAELRRRFKGEVLALSEYLDRDLVRLWGYESVE